MEKKEIVFLIMSIIAIVGLASYIVILQSDIVQLKIKHNQYVFQTDTQIANLNKQIQKLQTEQTQLSIELQNSKNENTKLEIDLNSSKQANQALQGEVDTTITKIESFESELETSMQWFSTNSEIVNTGIQERVEDLLNQNCYKIESDKCTIRAGCFYLINDKNLILKYKTDIKTTGKSDKLVSIKEFIDNNGGDCEDYSLFYKAEWNHVLDQCDGKEIIVETWTIGIHEIWLNFKETWYLTNAKQVFIEDGSIYPNIVCGNVLDLNTFRVNGHCIIALTKQEINNINDLGFFDGAVLIEPQNGGYLGRLNEPSSGIYLLTNENFFYSPISNIRLIVTNKDLFLFSREYGEWLSYSSLQSELILQKDHLVAVKN